jgi:hypothetical protein
MTRFKRLYPWYLKVEASYALEFEHKVRELRYRFIVEGLIDDDLLLVVQGKDGAENIQKIASKLRDLAFQLEVKGVNSESA